MIMNMNSTKIRIIRFDRTKLKWKMKNERNLQMKRNENWKIIILSKFSKNIIEYNKKRNETRNKLNSTKTGKKKEKETNERNRKKIMNLKEWK